MPITNCQYVYSYHLFMCVFLLVKLSKSLCIALISDLVRCEFAARLLSLFFLEFRDQGHLFAKYKNMSCAIKCMHLILLV